MAMPPQHQMMGGGMGQPMTGPPGGGGMGNMMEQAKKFPMTWKLAFFVAACCVTFAGALGTLAFAFTKLEPFGLLDQIYLLLFGLLMLVIDWPVQLCPGAKERVEQGKLVIYKYLLFMTRFSGRGVWYLFLGCMSFGSLWDNNISPFLGFFIGGYVVALGGASIYFGVIKSLKLEKVRKAVQGSGRGNMLCPQGGLTGPMFNELAHGISGQTFSEEEQEYVLHAMSFTVKDHPNITQEEFMHWQTGRMTLM